MCTLDAVDELAARDETDRGLGDAPYPPNHPKMAGEPLRSRPSVAVPAAERRAAAEAKKAAAEEKKAIKAAKRALLPPGKTRGRWS